MNNLTNESSQCPVSHTLNIMGDKWTVLIIRDLMLKGPQKNQDFMNSLQSISPTVLSNRLKNLVDAQIIESVQYCAHPPRFQYQLTYKGLSLRYIIESLRDWGIENSN